MDTSRHTKHRLIAATGALALGLMTLGGAATTATAGTLSGLDTGRQSTPQAQEGTAASTTIAPSRGRGERVTRARLRHVLHATWVTGGKSPVTHSTIRGQVTAVSASSITIAAKDGAAMSFTLSDATKIHQRSRGSMSSASIGSVKVGMRARVLGVGTDPQARQVVFADATPGTPPTASPGPTSGS